MYAAQTIKKNRKAKKVFGEPREATPWENGQIAILLHASGGRRNLVRWIDDFLTRDKRPRGRPKKLDEIDRELLARANDIFRSHSQRVAKPLSVAATLGMAIDQIYPKMAVNKRTATLKRLQARLRLLTSRLNGYKVRRPDGSFAPLASLYTNLIKPE